jgi:23S rRNA pseudouridine1911/1915/1917 synthase
MGEVLITVDGSAETGIRLDRYCAMQPGAVSRSRLKNGLLSVTVNGQNAKMSRIVHSGDIIRIAWEDPVPEGIFPEDIPLDIVYEDENVTVVNKRQGMVTHPGAGNWTGTLVNALLAHWKRSAPEGNQRPGIVHRLDKDTSGILITARNPETETWLQGEFRERKVKKVYIAILAGVPNNRSGDIRTWLFRDPKNRKRFTWSEKPGKGRFSHTTYRVVRVYGPYALVLFSLQTGRTHQLRVHSKYLGTPILGDPIYGKKDALFASATLMLHAKRLKITLPGHDRRSVFIAPLPLRFKKVLSTLKKEFPS